LPAVTRMSFWKTAPLVALVAIVPVERAPAQDIGHKVLGSIGLDAGSQPDEGLYVMDRFVYYRADTLRDQDGTSVPIGLDLDAYALVLGAAWVVEISPKLYFSAAVGVPLVGLSLSTEEPRAEVDQFGLSDMALKPIGIGWRGPRLDLVGSVAVFAPTRTFGNGRLGRSQWSEQLSAGGTLFFTADRSWRYSVLLSYDLYQRRRGVDITRGDTLSAQGGVGTTIARLVDVGAIGYAHWQVRDHRGADLPPILEDARDRVFGLGLEIGTAIPPMRSKLSVRWAHDLGAESRPEGEVVVVALSSLLYRPTR
jgi:hypothetical protein